MCEFCKNVETGNDYNPIVSSEINLGFAGTLFIDVSLGRGAKMNLDCCMDTKDNNSSKSVKINFCPMCGRKLER